MCRGLGNRVRLVAARPQAALPCPQRVPGPWVRWWAVRLIRLDGQTLVRADNLATMDGQIAGGVDRHVEMIQRLVSGTAHDIPVRVELTPVAVAKNALRRDGSEHAHVTSGMSAGQRHRINAP